MSIGALPITEKKIADTPLEKFDIANKGYVDGKFPSSHTAHGVFVDESAFPIVAISPGTSGQVLTSNGASADPSFQTRGITKGTVANQGGLTGTASPGTNTDNVITHGLGRTPVKVTISCGIFARGGTNASGQGSGIGIYDSSSSNPIMVTGFWTDDNPNGAVTYADFNYMSGAFPFVINGSGANFDSITIQVINIGATTFTLRINDTLTGVSQGTSQVSNISWICE